MDTENTSHLEIQEEVDENHYIVPALGEFVSLQWYLPIGRDFVDPDKSHVDKNGCPLSQYASITSKVYPAIVNHAIAWSDAST